ncbi:hypothetical protein Ahy_B04g072643 isoform A [Arachis hypogaea]|uniref:Uncharacterized protein n=1 Tax=Arachis hypogaea TaxID=3818 RepID=A0A444ZNG4_ARAHY|nr:hypothetical protein Ahy_B04g072643 isoform A [Arachis hypogaea]
MQLAFGLEVWVAGGQVTTLHRARRDLDSGCASGDIGASAYVYMEVCDSVDIFFCHRVEPDRSGATVIWWSTASTPSYTRH